MTAIKIKATEYQKAQSTLLQVTSMSRMQYSELMFAHGSAFAEHYCRQFLNKEEMTAALLSNRDYWNWFVWRFAQDDAYIISQDKLNCQYVDENGDIYNPTYHDMKSAMIGDKALETDLYHHLKPIICP